MSTIVCPYCFEKFSSSDVMFRCSNENCVKADDPELHKFWGKVQMELPAVKPKFSFGSLFGSMPESAKCHSCDRTTFNVICPHCHNRLPKEMVRNRGYIISIIGARSSGKTNYITTLINELQHKGWMLGNISMMASAISTRPEYATGERYKRDFYDVMYNKQRLPAATRG